MTRARAPGKVVLSGAYAVLEGAPAIVTAVERFVLADSSRRSELVTPEVQAALLPHEVPPWFDASELREDGRKLGLGSSAAIASASLFALERDAAPTLDLAALRQRVFERARGAHRAAQGGGSGVDVAASTFGGTLLYRLEAGQPLIEARELPAGLRFELWVCPSAASTADFLASVRRLAQVAESSHARWLGAQAEASEEAARALCADDAAGLLLALRAEQRALLGLGTAAGVPIVTAELAALAPLAEAEGGVLLPAGAGGGDIALFAGTAQSSATLRAALSARSHRELGAALSAHGVDVA